MFQLEYQVVLRCVRFVFNYFSYYKVKSISSSHPFPHHLLCSPPLHPSSTTLRTPNPVTHRPIPSYWFVHLCVCVSVFVKIVRTGNILAKMKNMTFVDFDICYRKIPKNVLRDLILLFGDKHLKLF